MGHIYQQFSQQVQGNIRSNTINNHRNHESVNVVTTIAQKEKLSNLEIKLSYFQILKRGVIQKVLQVSHQALGSILAPRSQVP